MKINPFVFRNYDIRGIAGKDLDAEKVRAIGKAYGTFLRRRKIRQAVVGRDCRLSGSEYQDAIMEGLVESGIDLIDIGMVMTQMVYYGQYRFQANGSVMITASHNPWNFNGFKFGVGYSQTTEPEHVQEIKQIVDTDGYITSAELGRVEKADIAEDYYRDVLKRVSITKKFPVVVDPHFGPTGSFVPEILRRAGCDVKAVNTPVDGHFPAGTPDPTDEALMKKLRDLVLEEKADLGFAFDGDGDRIGAVDERGHLLWNDVLVAIFAKEILERF